jgi:hypothetical protein
MRILFFIAAVLILNGCGQQQAQVQAVTREAQLVNWTTVDSIDVVNFNKDLEPEKLTMDVGIYFPSNFDSAFNKVTLSRLLESLLAAKEIYRPTNIQIKLLWVKTGELDPSYFAIQANEVPGIPETEYANTYINMRRHPAELTQHTKDAFASIIEPDEQNARTIYLVALQDVFYPFLEVSEGRNWTIKSVRTGGLSFPTYSYCNTLPDRFRGIITITNLARPDRYRRTVAHELGHKVMNVSHEYKTTNPGHEVFAEGGLMLYGSGEDIPAGADGRWHLERLHLSPFLYRLKNNVKEWNPDYREGGHYYDPIYGDKVVNFGGKAEIDKNW